MSDSLLTIKEAALELKVHWQTVRKYIKEGKLKSYKIGRSVRIKRSDIEHLLSNEKNTNDKLEYELRYFIRDRRKVEKKLIDIGAKVTSHSHIIDHWYIDKHIKNNKEKDEFYESVNGYGLRVRESDNDYSGKIITTVEIKKLANPPDHSICIEHEFDINDYNTANDFIRLINHKEFMTIDKDRIVYRYNEFIVVIDDIKDFGSAIEIEIKTNEDRDKTIRKIEGFAEIIGIEKIDRMQKGLTYLAMEKLAKY